MRISIVTPSFNQGAFLEEALLSVLDQTGVELEYLVLDGGSTDESAAILTRYGNRVQFLRTEPDDGQTAALIEGFSRATGEILAWLNSDDVYEPGVLAEVVKHFESHPDDRFVFGDATWIDVDGRTLTRKREMPFFRFIWTRTYNYIPQPSAFWRRDIYEEVGGLDPAFDLAMDADLFARFSERSTPRHVPRLWSRMRVHPDQKNIRLRDRSDREAETIRRRYTSASGARWAAERAVARVARLTYRLVSGAYWR